MGMFSFERADIEWATGTKLDAMGTVYGGARPSRWGDDQWRDWILEKYDECTGRVQNERANKVDFAAAVRDGLAKARAAKPETADARAKRLTEAGFATDYNTRKGQPVATGVLDYFPLALIAIAEVSEDGNNQHNPGEPLHWAREKSTDEANTVIRHFLQRGGWDGKVRHSAKAAWRMLALLQKEIENDIERSEKGKPVVIRGVDPGKEPGTVVNNVYITSPDARSPHDAGGPSVVDKARERMIANLDGAFDRAKSAAQTIPREELMSNGCPKPVPDTWKPIVIIESPYAGHTKRNMLFLKYAERDCLRRGFIPIASHRLLTEALDDANATDRELGMQAGFELHRLADRQIVYNELGVTPGMRRGITQWNEIHKHCRPTDWRMLPDDLRREYERECKELGARP